MAAVFCGGLAAQKPDAGKPSAEDVRDKKTFEAVCGSCHPASMAAEFRSEVEWTETIDKMVELGAKGTDEQLDRILGYLLRTWSKVNVNTAPASEIAPVLDIAGPAAEAVVKRRTELGGFKGLDELKKVPGVDAAKIEARKDRIVF